MVELGIQGLLSIVILLLSVFFVWTLLSVVKWEKIIHHPMSRKSVMLRIVIAVALGSAFGNFILKYLDYSLMLRYFVEKI